LETAEDFERRRAAEQRILRATRYWPGCGGGAAGTERPLLPLPETNWPNRESVAIGDYVLQYSYRRFDLQISGPPVYPGLSCDASEVYVSSGMAALSAVYTALDRVLEQALELWCSPDGYFETQHLARAYTSMLTVRSAPLLAPSGDAQTALACLHIDSISAADGAALIERHDFPWHRVLLAVVDTTCYARTDRHIERISTVLSGKGIFHVLVRSHLKLDAFGTESARFGSIVMCQPPAQHGYVHELVSAMRKIVADVVRSFGLAPVPGHLLPFHQSPEYFALMQARVDRIRDNSRRLAGALREALGDAPHVIREYHHGMFLTIHHPGWTGHAALEALAKEIVARCAGAGNRVHHATSFGFDFTAIAALMDIPSMLYVLRVSLSDEPMEKLEQLVDPMLLVLG
jgi:hypothetical protein